MSCEKTMQAVERFLEGEVGPEALAATTPEGAHAASCAACRAEVESALRLSEALQGALLTAPPEGALDRALEAVRAEAGAEKAATGVSAEAIAAKATTEVKPMARVEARAPASRFRRPLAVAASLVLAIGVAGGVGFSLILKAKHERGTVGARPHADLARAAEDYRKAQAGDEELVILATDASITTRIADVDVNQTGTAPYTFAITTASTGASATQQPARGWGSLPPPLPPVEDGKDAKLRRAMGAGLPVSKSAGDGGQYAGPNPYPSTDARYQQWQDQKDAATIASMARQAGVSEENQRAIEALAQEQEGYQRQIAALEGESRKQMARLREDMARASAGDRSKMQAELDKLSKQPNSEAARKIITENEASMVLIHAESYVQAKGALERTPICKIEATGFAIAPDRIVTAKHALQPWKYDPKVLATARKLKEEQGFEIQDYVEIYRKTAKGWEKLYDSASGTCKVLALAPDRLEASSRAVEIEWNQVVTAVPGIQVHERNVDDVAVLEVPGGGFRPVTLADVAAQKFDNAIILGTVRNPDGKLISVAPARAEVQACSDAAFRLNATVPTSFAGCPVFTYSGAVCGIVAGPEAQFLVCHPVSAIDSLLRATGHARPGAPTGSAAPSSGAAPAGSGGAAPGPDDDESEAPGRAPIMLPEGSGKGGNGGVEPGASAPRRGSLSSEEAFGRLGGGSLFARGEDGASVDLMPLERVSVQAEIAGTLATTLVRQRFGNPFPVKIEAVYAFPLPHDAAVNEFVMQIGDRRIRGIVRERQEARAIYNAARRAGRVASLLEQERPNVFNIAVANIEPARAVDVTIRFFQALAPQDGTLEYVLPLVIGHRYGDDARAVASGSATQDRGIMGGGHAAVAPPRTAASGSQAPAGAESPECEIDVAIDAGVPIASVECPSHDVALERYGPFRARVHLPSRTGAMDRDFVLRLRIGDEKEATFGVVAHAGPLGRFLQVVAAPPLAPDDAGVQAREVVFVLDSSGSMAGVPIEQSKRFIRKALASLRSKDVFTIATFAGTARLMSERFLEPTWRNVSLATGWVDSLSGAGGTEAEAGIKLALEMPGDARRVRIVVFLTDGGVSFEGDIFARIQRSGAGARVFALGVGSSPNRHLLDGMAEAGRGVAAYIAQDASEDVIARDVDRLYARLDAPVLCDVRVIAEGGIALDDVLPGDPPDLFVGRTLSIIARYRSGGVGTIVVRGRAGGQVVERRIPIALPSDDPAHAALAPIWARAAIAEREKQIPLAAQDRRAALEDEIRRLAIDFQLASRVTSFVAVDEGSRTGIGEAARVAQPAAVPAGVDPANFGGAGEGR